MALLTANIYEANNKIILLVLSEIWEDVYIKPYCRATPFLVGILLGFMFFKIKKVNLSKVIEKFLEVFFFRKMM